MEKIEIMFIFFNNKYNNPMRSDEDILRDLNNDDIDDVLIENTVVTRKETLMYYDKQNNIYTFKNSLVNGGMINVALLPTNTYVDSDDDNNSIIYIDDLCIEQSHDLLYADLLKFINNGLQLDVVSDWLFAGTLK